MSSLWLGLHNPHQHMPDSETLAWCITCDNNGELDDACYRDNPCHCCLMEQWAKLNQSEGEWKSRALKAEALLEKLEQMEDAPDDDGYGDPYYGQWMTGYNDALTAMRKTLSENNGEK